MRSSETHTRGRRCTSEGRLSSDSPSAEGDSGSLEGQSIDVFERFYVYCDSSIAYCVSIELCPDKQQGCTEVKRSVSTSSSARKDTSKSADMFVVTVVGLSD